MSDKIKHINRKIKIPQIRLWLIWFFLFVFPSILALVGLEQFHKKYAYFERTDLIHKAFENIKKYNEEIVPENFLENQIEKIQNLDSTLPFENLKNEIDKIFCGESLFCLFFDEKVEKITNIKSEKLAKNLKNLPINFFKNNIKILLEKELQKDKKKKDSMETFETNEQFAFLLQQIFKTATNIGIHLNKVSKNFSVKYDGELYFIICNFNNPSKECMGFLTVIQGKNFNFHNMLEKLNKFYPEIRIIFREVDINKNETNPEIFHSGLRQDKDGLHIIAPASAKFVRHVLHGGSTKLNKKYGNLFPFIDYYIPIWEYWENWNKDIHTTRLIMLIIILSSAIYFLNVGLFGFNEKITFKNKIISLLLIATIFPFGIFSLGFYSIKESEKIINKLQIQNYVESSFEYFSQELDDYIGKLETKLGETAKTISKLISKNSDNCGEIAEYFKKIGEDEEIPISASVLFFNDPPEKLKDICKYPLQKIKDICKNNKDLCKNYEESSKTFKLETEHPERISKSQKNYNQDGLSDIFMELTLKFAAEEELSSRKAENKIEILNSKYDNEIVNDFLKDKGEIRGINTMLNIYYFSLNFIYYYPNLDDHTDNEKIIGLFTANLEPRPIMKTFLEKEPKPSLAKIGYKEEKPNWNYKIDYAIIPLENTGDSTLWNGVVDYIDDKDKKLCLQNTSSGIIENKDKILIKRRNQFIPHLAVATIRKLDGYDYSLLIYVVGIIAYLSLILYFSNILLDMLIVSPVLLLASNARAIAKGSDKWETEIESGDEFEELNNSFKHLVKGLQERNILKSYVSEDAFSDIEESDNLKLQPGGEYLEATIVFSAIKDYDKLTSTMTPQESIKLLSKFMSLAEEATKKNGGSIDKIIGDTIMLVFRDNPNKDSHALRAAKASLELVEKAKSANLPQLYTGIASGRVISGRIGSYSGKLDFTVIGNPVNSAARFKTESKNGTTETGIIISGTTIGLTKGKAKVKFLRRVSIKGKARKYNIYELVGVRKLKTEN